MARHSGGLFDDDEALRLEQDREIERGVCDGGKARVRRSHIDGDRHPRLQPFGFAHPASVDPNGPRRTKRADPVPAEPWNGAAQDHVQPLIGLAFADFDSNHRHRPCSHIRTPPATGRVGPPVVCARTGRVYTPAPVDKRDYYVILEVSKTASNDEIKQAYRALAMRYHPDRNPGDVAAEDAFKEASEAYAVLSDPAKRSRYDRFGHSAFDSNGPGFEASDFGAVSEILEGLFGEVFSGGRRKRRHGRDLQYDLEITFGEAALGAEKEITVNRPSTCTSCGGNGAKPGTPVHKCNVCQGRGQVRYQRGLFAAARPCHGCRGTGTKIATPCEACRGVGIRTREESMKVRVPPGVKDGAVRTVRGAGEVGEAGQSGDLHVHIHVKEHSLFDREGADIQVTVPISFPQAVLGASIEVPTLEGKVTMKVPPGTQSGKVFRLRGKGIPVYGGYGKGDQLVTVVVEVPTEVSRRQRKLIAELAQEIGDEGHAQQASFISKLRGLFES